jgi:hypothetical protein
VTRCPPERVHRGQHPEHTLKTCRRQTPMSMETAGNSPVPQNPDHHFLMTALQLDRPSHNEAHVLALRAIHPTGDT